MNPPRVKPEDYIDFLIATPKAASAVEAALVQPVRTDAPAHDAFTRLLHRLEPDPEALWREARPLVDLARGALVLDDTVLDKPHARHIDLVGRHWSGKHRAVVRGIDLVSLVWADGDRVLPCDYRIYHDPQQATKNDHFRAMIDVAHARGLRPAFVLFDSWYASLGNLKHVRALGWAWLTRLKANRLVNKDRQGQRPLSRTDISAQGTVVWLTGHGLVKVLKIVAPDGGIDYWASSELTTTDLQRQQMAEHGWAIETCHKGIQQCAEAERCQARSARAQRNHIGLALRAFLRLQWHLFSTGISWLQAKACIIRDAIRSYLAHPSIRLPTA
jgi:hypothetical protein